MRPPDSQSWLAAKARGDAVELGALAVWAGLGFAAYLRPGAHRSDLLVQARVEHKMDLAAARTGNVAIEFLCSGKPSGIATTDADVWCVTAAGQRLVVPTAKLRYLAEHGPFRIVRAGDGHRTLCVLVPLAELRRSATLVLPAGEVTP